MSIAFRPFLEADMPMFERWLHVAARHRHPDEWLAEIQGREDKWSWIHHFIAELDKTPIGLGAPAFDMEWVG
ncbi:MAG: hypothetical protein LBU32_20445 [Clostridiales bacterium]|jgi:hypothetical protein|nr:hypothetical protein [Clostridiales bacterium]